MKTIIQIQFENLRRNNKFVLLSKSHGLNAECVSTEKKLLERKKKLSEN
jgi:hypothetical protein